MNRKACLFFLLTITLLASCSQGQEPTATLTASASTTNPSPIASNTPIPTEAVAPMATATPISGLENLKVVYVKESNIWLWTQAGGSAQLTFSGADCCVKISG